MTTVPRMLSMVWDLILASAKRGTSPESMRKRCVVDVWDFRRYAKLHAFVKKNGFHHVGMYHQMQESVALMLRSGRTYDVVIRTRWDLFIAAKFAFQRLPGDPARYLVDLGSHCRMDGVWYPRTVVVEDGKTIRHIADTRFKLFGWQSCDWLDVGTFDTIAKFGALLDWIRNNNVYGGAQWVEHAFFVDQGIAVQPAHLYVCLHRHSSRFFC
jgi:hypothetical protein